MTNDLKKAKTSKQKRLLKRRLYREKVKRASKLCINKYSTDVAILSNNKKELYTQVYYTRYLDEFLLGVRGSKESALEIRQKIIQYLQADLHLKLDQVSLTHSKENKIRFLGFDIKVSNKKEQEVLYFKQAIAFAKLRNRIKIRKFVLNQK